MIYKQFLYILYTKTLGWQMRRKLVAVLEATNLW